MSFNGCHHHIEELVLDKSCNLCCISFDKTDLVPFFSRETDEDQRDAVGNFAHTCG